ncbi:MAG: glycyl radical protein [Christensenellales bacterium]
MSFIGVSGERIKKMREYVLSVPWKIDLERVRIATAADRKYQDKPVVVKRALMLKETLENISVYIHDGDMLAGNHASQWRGAPIFPEYSNHWIFEEIDQFDKRPGDIFYIDEDQKPELLELCEYWRGKATRERGYAYLPEETMELYKNQILRAEGSYTAGDGHIAVDYGWVLREGMHALKERTQKRIDALDPSDYVDMKKLQFLRAVIIVFDAMEIYALRYSRLAAEMAEKETDPKRKQELLRMSEICAHVPMKPARNFWEAVQCTWFIHMCLQLESNGHSLSYGRLDQFLYPCYKMDKDAGTITEEEACELLENLWIKTYSINKIRGWDHTKHAAGNPLYQNATIGGQTRDGKDAVNDVSYLALKSYGRVRLTQPNLSVRYFEGNTDEFLKGCIEVLKLGTGMPAFMGDKIIIESLMKWGVTLGDARDYSAVGCVEVCTPGKWGYRCTGMCFTNFPQMLMIVMNGGVDPVSGYKLRRGNYKHFLEMESYDELMESWDQISHYLIRQAVIVDNGIDLALEEHVPDVLCSALVHDCIDRGLHLKEGGAVYDMISGIQQGIANAANAMAALKKLVFEEKALTKEQVWHAVETNFEGIEGEKIRQILINNAPKYGNDIPYVDELAARLYEPKIDELMKAKNTRYGRGPIGGGYYAGTSGVSSNVPMGKTVGATPDGRKAYEPLSEGCSPYRSTDLSGPTAVMKSVVKLPTEYITGGIVLNQKISPSSLSTPRDEQKLMFMLRTYFDALSGFHVQYNVVDRAVLLEAKAHPEEYRDLIVRVAGYSAFFNVLPPESQDDIIARTEHVL